MNTEEPNLLLSLTAIAAEFNAAGLTAYVAQTGGGCATIYVGPWFRDEFGDQHPAFMVGPGHFNSDGTAHAYAEELSCGDGLGNGPDLHATWQEMEWTFADRCIEYMAKELANVTAEAATSGLSPYNGIG
jgi:hypothetical protein